VWAAGEAWHYAPLATSLARLGVITCVMQYTLYPDALVPQLVQEVAAAFDWALENVGSYGGDARKVCGWLCGCVRGSRRGGAEGVKS
jgi:acetyl esterase/lipase